MDFNKDNAMRTKCVAEDNFSEKDFVGARKLAQKAKDLLPGLSFITLFITIIDIHISREIPDWYGVVGLEYPATLEQICEKYFNLHHDIKSVRDNVIGAKVALEILSEVFCFLTNTFWTECPGCLLQFQYSSALANKNLKCFNCSAIFLAVKLPPGLLPKSPRTMNHFQRQEKGVVAAKLPSGLHTKSPRTMNHFQGQEKSAVLALGVLSRDNVGDEGTSNGSRG